MIYRAVLAPSALGLAIGSVAAVGLARFLKSLLFQVTPGDVRTLTIAGLTLLAVSVLAATAPALRAGLTDPAKILRSD
jgi:ABC-type lipoprotein release transport system permease subunit